MGENFLIATEEQGGPCSKGGHYVHYCSRRCWIPKHPTLPGHNPTPSLHLISPDSHPPIKDHPNLSYFPPMLKKDCNLMRRFCRKQTTGQLLSPPLYWVYRFISPVGHQPASSSIPFQNTANPVARPKHSRPQHSSQSTLLSDYGDGGTVEISVLYLQEHKWLESLLYSALKRNSQNFPAPGFQIKVFSSSALERSEDKLQRRTKVTCGQQAAGSLTFFSSCRKGKE